ncbi:hypothetical protein RSOLAG1IB_00570 [Rhizoctonia solani AG-1 IB]|uniref:Uncharacterized protein n=1 Tax=Thanatephorus cucumeris (strain AG1-IB / isolate 7/3/14) TaxID=1108050 RepID=A0A0B7F753_THACB|nr:hypothetical protein RSOLAG1IB_00570 [Rhizoctonia solani AG-1 IB]
MRVSCMLSCITEAACVRFTVGALLFGRNQSYLKTYIKLGSKETLYKLKTYTERNRPTKNMNEKLAPSLQDVE